MHEWLPRQTEDVRVNGRRRGVGGDSGRDRRAALRGAFAAGVAAAIACDSNAPPLRIGVVVGGDGSNAVELISDDLRGKRVGGRRVDLDIVPFRYATAAEPSIAVADSLASDARVIAVVGHSNSAASLAASQIYNSRHLVHIAPTSTAPLFSQAGPYSYRLVPDDARQAEFIARCVENDGRKRVAIVYVNDDYGRGLEGAIRPRLAAAGVQIAYEIPYLEKADSAALVPIAAPLAASRPEVIVWLGRFPELQIVRRVAADPLQSIPVLASDGVDAAGVYAHPENFPNVRFVRFIDPAAPDTGLQRMRERYAARFKLETSTEAVLSYDAVGLVLAAIDAGVHDREAMRTWLDSLGHRTPPYIGLSGPIAFDANGDVARAHQLAEVRDDGVHAVPGACTQQTRAP